MSFSTAYEPPAGSATWATCDSSMSRWRCCGRSGGRSASGRPSGLSNGSTVTLSAPPTPAAKAATVVRSMFTQGSYLLIIGRLVTACRRMLAAGVASLSSSTRAHSRRAARSLAIVGELLVGRGVAELDQARGLVDAQPGVGEGAEVRRAGGHRPAELLGVGGAAVVDRGRVDDERRGSRRSLRRAGERRRSRRRAGTPRLVLGVQLAALGVARGTPARVAAVEHDRREVEQHAVEQRRRGRCRRRRAATGW